MRSNTVRRKVIRLISMFILVCFSIQCVSSRVIRTDRRMPVSAKTVVLHWKDQSYQVTDVSLEDNQLHGLLHPPPRFPRKVEELHIYVNSTFVPPEGFPTRISIDFSVITKVEIYETDPVKSVLVAFAAGGCCLGLVSIIAVAMKQSCPFVYAFNGESFEFTGEIYSGSIHPPLERHDYLPLTNLTAVNDEYRVKISNEIKEIQHTNLANLIVIDHPLGTEVLVDKYGVTHTLSNLQTPSKALNLKEESIYDQIVDIDSLSYIGDVIGEEDDPLDEIVICFPRPEGSNNAKLVINGKNSFWLDYIYGQFYDLFGDRYTDWNEKRKDASESGMRKWSLEQGIPLSVYVEKLGEWEFVDYFNIVGPMAAKKDVLELDISDVESEDLNLKLKFGYFFWEIDYIAIDYSEELEVRQNVVTMKEAINQNGEDVAGAMIYDDDKYYVQPQIGDEAILTFPVPSFSTDSKRTTILHSKGHYEIIRDPQGKPDIDLLTSFRSPERFAEFSKERFLKIYGNISTE
jgi:hypothetical protein